LAIAFLRESSDFLAGVNVESKEIFDPNTVCMAGLVLPAPGQVSSGVASFDFAVGVMAGGLLALVSEKHCLLFFLGRPPKASVLSSGDIFQEMLVLALSAPRRVGS
jgi:hypothetical protein